MRQRRAWSAQTLVVMASLAADPTRWRHGYDLCRELELKSGSLYPILMRLEDRGLLEASWEQAGTGKPPRHLYRLTDAGLRELEAAQFPSRPRAATALRTRIGDAQ